MSTPSDETVFQSHRWIWWPWGFLLITMGFAVAYWVVKFVTGPGRAGFWAWMTLVGWAFWLLLSSAMFRQSLRIDGTGITASSVFTSHHFPWSDISEFAMGPAPLVVGSAFSAVSLANNRPAVGFRIRFDGRNGRSIYVRRRFILNPGDEVTLQRVLGRLEALSPRPSVPPPPDQQTYR